MQNKKLFFTLIVSLPLVASSLHGMNNKTQRKSLKIQLSAITSQNTLTNVMQKITLTEQLLATYNDKNNNDQTKHVTTYTQQLITLKKIKTELKEKNLDDSKEDTISSIKELFNEEKQETKGITENQQPGSSCIIS